MLVGGLIAYQRFGNAFVPAHALRYPLALQPIKGTPPGQKPRRCPFFHSRDGSR